MREARIAGAMPASSVTAVPTTTDTTAVAPVKASPPAGRLNPTASNRPFRRPATARPPNTPAIDAISPVITASRSTEPST